MDYIQSPLSKKLIPVDGKTYNKLKTTGFIVEEKNNDTLCDMLRESSMNQIKAICKNNTTAQQMVNQKSYWDKRYGQYQLPYLCPIIPENVDEWVAVFIKTQLCFSIAAKLVSQILETKKFKIFEAKIKNTNWLPKKFKDCNTLQFKVKTKKDCYYVTSYQNDDLVYQLKVDQNKFILYLTKLFYFTNNVKLTHDKYTFKFNQLKSGHDDVKKCFNDW